MTTNEAPPLQESNYFTPQGEFRVDSAGSQTLLNCLMYKLAYYRFGEVQMYNGPSGDSAHFSCDVIVYQLFVARLRQDSECGNWQQEHKAALLGRGIHVGALVGQDLPVSPVWWPRPL